MTTPYEAWSWLYGQAREKFQETARGASERFVHDMDRATDNYRAASQSSSPEVRRQAQTRYDQAEQAARMAYDSVYQKAYNDFRAAVAAARRTAWEGRS